MTILGVSFTGGAAIALFLFLLGVLAGVMYLIGEGHDS